MSSFDLVTSGFDSTMASLRIKSSNIISGTEEATRKQAEEILKEIQETAPVDTGRYKNDWRIEEEGDFIFIINDVPYGQHLVFPNANFVGSPHADDPGAGILHNVRGIVHSNQSGFLDGVRSRLRGLLG